MADSAVACPEHRSHAPHAPGPDRLDSRTFASSKGPTRPSSFLALLLLAVSAGAAEDDTAKRLDELLNAVWKTGTPGFSVAVIQHGRPVYEKGFGSANLEYDIPVRPQTIYHVASVSKQFTAMAVGLLEEDGKLSLEDDLHKYTVKLKDGKLTAEHIRHGTIELLPAAQDQFTTREWFMHEVKFQRDSAGKVSGVTLGGGRLSGILFKRKPATS